MVIFGTNLGRFSRRRGEKERFPFTKKFRKFRLGCKWNTTFWFVPLEIFRNKRNFWKSSSVFPVETSQWEICVPFTDFSYSLFLSPVPYLSRSFPGVPRLPRMELVANGTRSSQTEIPNRNFPKDFVNGKCPKAQDKVFLFLKGDCKLTAVYYVERLKDIFHWFTRSKVKVQLTPKFFFALNENY